MLVQVRVGRSAVTRLRLSADQTSLFTCSADGAVCMLDIQDRDFSRGGKQCALVLYAAEPCIAAYMHVAYLSWISTTMAIRLESLRLHI